MSECAPLKLSGDRGGFPPTWDGAEGDCDRLSGEGDRGPWDRGEWGGDLAFFLDVSLLSEDELLRLLELELLLLDDEWSRESSESISAKMGVSYEAFFNSSLDPNPNKHSDC